MVKNLNSVYGVILKYTIKVAVAGLIIGLLYKNEYLIALLLVLRIIYRIHKLKRTKSDIKVPIIGMLITGFLGTLIEYYGTKYNYWEYHDISGQLPKYLFFVWMLAFNFMYSIEKSIFIKLKPSTRLNRFLIIFFVVIFFPTLGEIITISLGVWTYFTPLKILGVSIYTILSIAFAHLVINYIMMKICKKFNIKDIVLNPF